MANIYNSLKNVLQELKNEHKNHPSFVFLLFTLVTIPLGYALNNAALGLLVLSTLFFLKKEDIKISPAFIFPILLFVLMALSYLWSIDKGRTFKAIPKEISLLLIPIAFILFKDFTSNQKDKILKFYSWSIVLYTFFCLVKATARFFISGDTSVFFYHELVTKEVNAIHVSVYVSLAFFWFFTKSIRKITDKIAIIVLFIMVFLLSSKNIIVVFLLLIALYYFFYTQVSKKMRLRNLVFFIVLLIPFFFIGKIKERFEAEFQSNTTKNISPDVIKKDAFGINTLSIKEAWTNERFTPNDYFPGTAFRVYQFRIFIELLGEEPIFLKGFGLNASFVKLEEKGIKYNVFQGNENVEGYQKKNFHNQYVQNFAELGIFGLLLLIAMLFITIKNAFQAKDFLHIAFAILMISLFLTESFLWRQRGVVFFTIFYCLFNTKSLINAKINR